MFWLGFAIGFVAGIVLVLAWALMSAAKEFE
jgi:tetrahydromethanopterin S-methyltransferase subunit F